MLNGLIWVIVIFVLQAVIAGLAKRAQQNAQQKPPNGAQPTTGDLIDPTQPVRVANAPKKAKLPKVADASTVVVKRPTSIVTGKRSARQQQQPLRRCNDLQLGRPGNPSPLRQPRAPHQWP
jgi:hypothetical protein